MQHTFSAVPSAQSVVKQADTETEPAILFANAARMDEPAVLIEVRFCARRINTHFGHDAISGERRTFGLRIRPKIHSRAVGM